jgi:phosphatidylinositol kinase/protein kinase (PI-3  family)
LVSLGQWSSPYYSRPVVEDEENNVERKRNWVETKRRLNQMKDDLPTKAQKSKKGCQLPYGSDHEEESKDLKLPNLNETTKKRSSLLQSRNDEKIADRCVANTSSKQSHRPPPIVFRESWAAKQERIRLKSAFGSHPGWKLLPILIKANDDLRQEQLACQLIHRMAIILASEKVNTWLYPYEIIALTDTGGMIEAIPDTISLDSLKKNGGRNYKSLNGFFVSHFGEIGSEELAGAKANFVESLAAYSIICFLLQIKDRHNGNILLDSKGHIIHIDFGL